MGQSQSIGGDTGENLGEKVFQNKAIDVCRKVTAAQLSNFLVLGVGCGYGTAICLL